MARQPSPWSGPDIRRRCAVLREQLTVAASDVVSATELEDYWPGGKENTIAEPRGQWIYCYANYTRLADRLPAGDWGHGSVRVHYTPTTFEQQNAHGVGSS